MPDTQRGRTSQQRKHLGSGVNSASQRLKHKATIKMVALCFNAPHSYTPCGNGVSIDGFYPNRAKMQMRKRIGNQLSAQTRDRMGSKGEGRRAKGGGTTDMGQRAKKNKKEKGNTRRRTRIENEGAAAGTSPRNRHEQQCAAPLFPYRRSGTATTRREAPS